MISNWSQTDNLWLWFVDEREDVGLVSDQNNQERRIQRPMITPSPPAPLTMFQTIARKLFKLRSIQRNNNSFANGLRRQLYWQDSSLGRSQRFCSAARTIWIDVVIIQRAIIHWSRSCSSVLHQRRPISLPTNACTSCTVSVSHSLYRIQTPPPVPQNQIKCGNLRCNCVLAFQPNTLIVVCPMCNT